MAGRVLRRLNSLVAAGLLTQGVCPHAADAAVRTELRYRFDQVWPAALRLVRVDLGCEIRERDAEAGFVLFDYKEGSRVVPGSIEVIRTEGEGEGQQRLRVIV